MKKVFTLFDYSKLVSTIDHLHKGFCREKCF